MIFGKKRGSDPIYPNATRSGDASRGHLLLPFLGSLLLTPACITYGENEIKGDLWMQTNPRKVL